MKRVTTMPTLNLVLLTGLVVVFASMFWGNVQQGHLSDVLWFAPILAVGVSMDVLTVALKVRRRIPQPPELSDTATDTPD